MDPPSPVPGVGNGALLDVMPAEAIDALAAVSGPDTPLLSVELRHLGGALARTGEGCGAAGDAGRATSRSTPWAWRPTRTRRRRSRPYLEPWWAGRGVRGWDAGRRYPLTSPENGPVDTRSAYSAAAYRRLRAVKTLVDPDNLFRANHPIAPID